MKKFFTITFIFTSTFLVGQTSCQKCNISIAGEIQKNKEEATSNMVLYFLCSFDEACKNNVEFSEISNETVFYLLNTKPKLFLKTLDNSSVDTELILEAIENPINDAIDLQVCYNRIAEQNKSMKHRAKVLDALTKAASKLNRDIKKSQEDEN